MQSHKSLVKRHISLQRSSEDPDTNLDWKNIKLDRRTVTSVWNQNVSACLLWTVSSNHGCNSEQVVIKYSDSSKTYQISLSSHSTFKIVAGSCMIFWGFSWLGISKLFLKYKLPFILCICFFGKLFRSGPHLHSYKIVLKDWNGN